MNTACPAVVLRSAATAGSASSAVRCSSVRVCQITTSAESTADARSSREISARWPSPPSAASDAGTANPIAVRNPVRQPPTVAVTVSPVKPPPSRATVVPANDGLSWATADNRFSAASTARVIAADRKTARPMAAAWVCHGSKKASAPDWARVGATADSFS